MNKPETELVKKFFNVQKEHSVKDDWIEQIEQDLNTLEINLSEEEIMLMKKDKFKKIIKEKLVQKASESLYLLQQKHSKTIHLKSFELQSYFSSPKFTKQEKKLLFSLRTRSVEVKETTKINLNST